ncbi:MAG: monovalent cation/H+ antiporter subunit D family protein [Pseudomonadota bacterium]
MAGEVGTVVHETRTLIEQLPALQVVVPMLSAPLIVILGSRGLARWIAFGASLVSLVISFLLMMQVIDGTFISYTMGGWEPPLGIEYRVDIANAFVLFLISAIGVVTLPFALKSVAHEIPESKHTLFWACWMLCMTGLLGMVITGDAFNIFVFLEVSSLSTYVLVAQGMYKDRRALTAAFDYLIMGTIGATFFVIGLGMIYMATGTLNLIDIAARIEELGVNRTLRSGFAFVMVGMGLKVAMFPLHLWLPKAYVFAPSAVTVFLSATATKAAIYVILRFIFTVFDPTFAFAENTLEIIFLPLAIFAMFSASFVAVFQTNFKRMLAYSSIAQIGYMLLGVAMLSQIGLAAGIVHLFNHGITKALMFMGVGALVIHAGGAFYTQLAGLGRQMPLTGAAIVVGGLSLIGIPGTAGFVSKWLLVQAAFERGVDQPIYTAIAFAILVSSLLAVVYVWRAFEVLYLQKPTGAAKEAHWTMIVPMWILALACIYFGIDTSLTVEAATEAANVLIRGTVEVATGGVAQ